jgi:hypothetical protein
MHKKLCVTEFVSKKICIFGLDSQSAYREASNELYDIPEENFLIFPFLKGYPSHYGFKIHPD